MQCNMKTTVIITILLATQVSASFFDVFQGAVLSVQNGFGKLLSDVVSDVRDTVDCTILAVEHVLSISEDATNRYYEKCTVQNSSFDNVKQTSIGTTTPPKVQTSVAIANYNNNEYLKKTIPEEISAAINKTISEILDSDQRKIQNKIENIEEVLVKESDRLADVSVLVKQELDKLSSEVTSDLKIIENKKSSLSIEGVLDEVKLLQDTIQNDKNTSETREIQKAINKVFNKLDIIEATETSENAKLEEILEDLESHSNASFVDVEKQFEEWKDKKSKYIDDIGNKMEKETKDVTRLLTFKDVANHIFSGISGTTNESGNDTLDNDDAPATIIETQLPTTTDSQSKNNNHVTFNEQSWVEMTSNIRPTSTVNPVMLVSIESDVLVTTDTSASGLSIGGHTLDQTTAKTTFFEIESLTEPTTIDCPYVEHTTISTLLFDDVDNSSENRHTNRKPQFDHIATTSEMTPTYQSTSTEESFSRKLYQEVKENKDADIYAPKTLQPIAYPLIMNVDYRPPFVEQSDCNLKISHHAIEMPLVDVTTISLPNVGSSKLPKQLYNNVEIGTIAEIRGGFENPTTKLNHLPIVLTTDKPTSNSLKLNVHDKTSLDYDIYFEKKNTEAYKKSIKEARKLIEDSKRADLIMNSILKNYKTSKSVFDS